MGRNWISESRKSAFAQLNLKLILAFTLVKQDTYMVLFRATRLDLNFYLKLKNTNGDANLSVAFILIIRTGRDDEGQLL